MVAIPYPYRERKMLFALAVFLLVLIANLLLLIYNLFYLGDSTSSTLYGINMLTFVLLSSILAIQVKPVPGEAPGTRRKTPFLYSMVGVTIISVIILSATTCFQKGANFNPPIILLLCILMLTDIVFIIYLRDHYYPQS